MRKDNFLIKIYNNKKHIKNVNGFETIGSSSSSPPLPYPS